MNKLTKGAIATAAGVILLMGGAGTLASWNSSASAGSSQTISAGQLSVTPAATPAAAWKNAAGTTITPASYKVVPGDVLTYTQTFTVAASGDNLFFTVGVTPGTFTNAAGAANAALAAQLTAGSTFTVNGGGITAATTPGTYKVGTGTSTITVSMTVTFPYGSSIDNSAQLGAVTLSAGAITLTQVATA